MGSSLELTISLREMKILFLVVCLSFLASQHISEASEDKDLLAQSTFGEVDLLPKLTEAKQKTKRSAENEKKKRNKKQRKSKKLKKSRKNNKRKTKQSRRKHEARKPAKVGNVKAIIKTNRDKRKSKAKKGIKEGKMKIKVEKIRIEKT